MRSSAYQEILVQFLKIDAEEDIMHFNEWHLLKHPRWNEIYNKRVMALIALKSTIEIAPTMES